MKLLFPLLAAMALFAAAPASAQLHERGISREGAVQSSSAGGNAFMCRMACTIEAGCTGWNWVRAGEDGPQARCELLTGSIQSTPDSCCDSGLNGDPRAAAVPGVAASRGNQYANRSTAPTGPPVQLTGDPTGGIWQDPALVDEEDADDSGGSEDDADDPLFAEQEDDARFESMADAEAPGVTAPTARITSSARPRSGGAPRYSVQREYQGAPAAPAAQAPAGVADPSRWIGG